MICRLFPQVKILVKVIHLTRNYPFENVFTVESQDICLKRTQTEEKNEPGQPFEWLNRNAASNVNVDASCYRIREWRADRRVFREGKNREQTRNLTLVRLLLNNVLIKKDWNLS
jgi:hypothetical protein